MAKAKKPTVKKSRWIRKANFALAAYLIIFLVTFVVPITSIAAAALGLYVRVAFLASAGPVIFLYVLVIFIELKRAKDPRYKPVLWLLIVLFIGLAFEGYSIRHWYDTKDAREEAQIAQDENYTKAGFPIYVPSYMTAGYKFHPESSRKSGARYRGEFGKEDEVFVGENATLIYSNDSTDDAYDGIRVEEYDITDMKDVVGPCDIERPSDGVTPLYECYPVGTVNGAAYYKNKDLYGNGEDNAYYYTIGMTRIELQPLTSEVPLEEAHKIISSFQLSK